MNRAKMGETFQAPMTFKNVRHFTYTIPAGWQKEQGDPTGREGRQLRTARDHGQF